MATQLDSSTQGDCLAHAALQQLLRQCRSLGDEHAASTEVVCSYATAAQRLAASLDATLMELHEGARLVKEDKVVAEDDMDEWELLELTRGLQ